MTTVALPRQRINSIDIVRGFVMVIMALDHVRDFFYKSPISSAGSVAMDPTNLATTTPGLFFTRWITHFCAPAFVLLTGAAAYLYGQKKSKKELSMFLLKRGIFLVLVEAIIITLGWTFNPFYNLIILQVIWAIGISMIILSLLVHINYKALLAVGLLIVCAHNLMDLPPVAKSLNGGFLPDLIYFSQFDVYPYAPQHFVLIVYAFLPWTGLMIIGYCFGKVYSGTFNSGRRQKFLLTTGFALIMSFIVLRLINVYGDPSPWAPQPRGPFFSFLSFLNVTKYPASLQFVCLTIGVALFLLVIFERVQNRFTSILNVFGRVPLLYYILHFYLIHTLVVIFFYIQGFGSKDIVTPGAPFLFRPPDFGVNLFGTYIVWLFVVVALYPLCAKYDRYKSTHHHWWLKYL